MIQELELVEDEINEVNPSTEPEQSVSEFIDLPEVNAAKVNTTEDLLTPYIKKVYRLKRIKNIRDLMSEVSTREKEDIDYGTIIYVGK